MCSTEQHVQHKPACERPARSTSQTVPPGRQWKESTFDKETFVLTMGDIQLTGNASDMAIGLMQRVTEACNASMARKRHPSGRKHVHWWNEEIAELRRNCNHSRRICQRARGRDNFTELQERFRTLRACLKRAIVQSKRRCYKEMCADIDDNPWGTGYKVVMRKMTIFRPPSITCPSRLSAIIESLFPQRAQITYSVQDRMHQENIPEVSRQEFSAVCQNIKLQKAPGVDGIPNIALKAAIECNAEAFQKVFNACIRERTFPKIWKRQRLVLIPKGNNRHDASGYRPICMIDTVGKLLEKLICRRLEMALGSEGLSYRQFGFRKSRSTVDAIETVTNVAREAIQGKRWLEGDKEYCAIITLDVKNAFNSADWDAILAALDGKDIPRYLIELIIDYFKDRVLLYDTSDGRKSYTISAGVPQGSVLGPILWNIMYDGILRLELPNGVQIIGFADDIALVVRGKHLDKLTRTCNDAIAVVRSWISSTGLSLADHKTEAILISSRKKMEYITVTVGDQRIASKQAIKYLGVMIDNRLTFKEHLKYIGRKSALATCALARLMPNIGGPRQEKRLLLSRVIRSIILYAAPIWAEATSKKTYRSQIDAAYRRCALRVTSAFRTVSADAALVIAGLMPLQLAADMERKRRIAGLAHSNHLEAMDQWQHDWDTSLKGRWTHRLISNIAEWTERKHGEVNFYLTQLLTGHGCFRAYLFKYKHDDDCLCPNCPDAPETAEHVFFVCPRYTPQRRFLETTVHAQVTVCNIVNVMLASIDNWNAVCAFAKDILTLQRIAERMRSVERESRTN